MKSLLAATLLAAPAMASDPVPPTLDAAYRTRLTVLWAGVTANIIAADVLSLYVPGTQEAVVEAVGSEDAVRWAMLGGAAIYQVPIWMMVGAQLLPPKAARWTTVAGAVVTAATVVGLGSNEPHYFVTATAQLVLLTGAVITAARWGRRIPPRGLAMTGLVTPEGVQVGLSGRF